MAKTVRIAASQRVRLYVSLFVLSALCALAMWNSGPYLANPLRLFGGRGSGAHVYQATIRTDHSGSDRPVVIQSFSSASIPQKYVSSVQSIRAHNPSYHYLFFADNEMEPFLRQHYPAYLSSFRKLPMFIQKLDYFRYIAVYHFGGFYFDLDMRAMRSLDELLKFDCVFPLEYQVTKLYGAPVTCRYPLTPFALIATNIIIATTAHAAITCATRRASATTARARARCPTCATRSTAWQPTSLWGNTPSTPRRGAPSSGSSPTAFTRARTRT